MFVLCVSACVCDYSNEVKKDEEIETRAIESKDEKNKRQDTEKGRESNPKEGAVQTSLFPCSISSTKIVKLDLPPPSLLCPS